MEQKSGALICLGCVHPGASGPKSATPVSPGVVNLLAERVLVGDSARSMVEGMGKRVGWA